MRPGRRAGRSGLRVWMRESPLENAMDDQIRITADGRGEVSVFVEAEGEVAERLGGIAGLLERAEHEVGNDALLGLSGELSQQALIVLRRDANFGRAGKRNAHVALPAVAIRIGPAGTRGSRRFAVTHGNDALDQVFDAEGIAKRARQFL